MQSSFIWPILKQTNILWLTIVLVSIVFLYYFVKVKFQKQASIKAYGILFYAFLFYSVSSISFVFLNAMDVFFNLSNDLYFSFLWLFPISILSALIGAIVGWMIFLAGIKVAKEYVFKLMNLSLIIIMPYLFYALLIKPVWLTFDKVLANTLEPIIGKDINNFGFDLIDIKPELNYFPAVPAQMFDSLDLKTQQGSHLEVLNNLNGNSYFIPLPLNPVEQIYVSKIPGKNLFALLILAQAIQAKSALLLIDSTGNIAYQSSFMNEVNRMSVSENGNYILLEKTTDTNELKFAKCLLLQKK